MRPHRFDIEGLFGRAETVSLDLTSNVKIIYGINGSGKTTILRLLDAILTGRLFEISNVNFSSLTLHMEDGKAIKATRTNRQTKTEPRQRLLFALKIELLSASGKPEHSSQMADEVDLANRVPLEAIEHEIQELSRVGRREWSDATTGDILSLSDVIVKYSDRLPWLQPSTDIGWYRKIIRGFSVKFIQTQRLMIMKADADSYRARRGVRYQNTVIDYSERLRELIKDKLSDSMRMAQSLDSSYPRRLLQEKSTRLSDKRLNGLLDKTERLGAKLRQVELLSSGDNLNITLESISEENRRAIALYLSDSVKKYKILEPFADKLLLFLDIVNTKFRPSKSVQIGGREGIRIGLSGGGEIHPQLLSSGEQHEIVLLFDLIFFSKPGTLVLIDEPEISLHIDWQKKFLSDVEAIGKAADLKFLLATHSPAIIGTRVDICEEI
jgi:predicted ATP-binding protein involved in virulence